MRQDFLVFGAPAIDEDEIAEVVDCLRAGWIGTGPRAARFEDEFRQYKGRWGHPIAVNSCTAALHVSFIAAGLEPGSEVITTPLTFCSTVNAIVHAGLTPVLADVDPRTMNIDPSSIERALTARTRAIVPVHFAGRACDMDGIRAIADRHQLLIVEDCAHAIETQYRGAPAGTLGDFGCFSFYVTKNLTSGEGGLILARDEQAAARCRVLSLHGLTKDAWKRFGDAGYRHYAVVECGFKYNMMDMQAALALHQLRKVEARWIRRREIWQRYMTELDGLGLQLPAPPDPDSRHAFHLFTILVDQAAVGIGRDEFMDRMTKRRIGVGVHYLSLPDHPFYARTFGWRSEHYPAAARIGRQTVSIPLSAKLTDSDVDDVIDAVRHSLS